MTTPFFNLEKNDRPENEKIPFSGRLFSTRPANNIDLKKFL
jgi:hypothetical protein